MQYFLVMKVVDCETNLCYPVHDLPLSKTFTFFFGLFDFEVHIPHIAINHDNAKVTLSVSKGVLEGDNIGMS